MRSNDWWCFVTCIQVVLSPWVRCTIPVDTSEGQLDQSWLGCRHPEVGTLSCDWSNMELIWSPLRRIVLGESQQCSSPIHCTSSRSHEWNWSHWATWPSAREHAHCWPACHEHIWLYIQEQAWLWKSNKENAQGILYWKDVKKWRKNHETEHQTYLI